MNLPPSLRRLRSGPVGLVVSVVATVLAAAVIAHVVDTELLRRAALQARREPAAVVVALLAFGLAFVIRAIAWRRVLPTLGLGHALSAILVGLGANHVLPLRLGEPLRVVSITRRAAIPLDAAVASAVALRGTDVLALVAIGIVLAPTVFLELIGPLGWLVLAPIAAVAAYGWRWLARLAAGDADRLEVRRPGPLVITLASVAWGAEAVVVWQTARWAGLDLAPSDALLVTTVAVAAQIVAVAPGGFGTYEAAAVAAFVALGHDPDAALVASLGAHGLKTVFALGAGSVAILVPAPGMLGRFRLGPARHPGVDRRPQRPRPDAPVVLFMPAHDEEGSVGSCVRRVPSEVGGHPVEVLVIDDGSTDATAERALAAGAEVISLSQHRGLGAAVRVGLAEAVGRGAAVVAFCDADGEYPPEELATVVGPILSGDADYVAGSRFLGRIDRMRLHRRVGNMVLTAILSIVARTRITDGQTGFRALSVAAAREAEIIHDYNYAQVLTLDLLAKGFRFLEVPITYRFRTEGRSFVTTGRYLRTVGPAVYRELNASPVERTAR